MCFRRQFLCKMWPIPPAFLLFIVCRIFLSSLTPNNTQFLIRSVLLIVSILLQHLISELCRHICSTFYLGSPMVSSVYTYTQTDKGPPRSVHPRLLLYPISQLPAMAMEERSSTSQLTRGSSFHFTFFSFFSPHSKTLKTNNTAIRLILLTSCWQ
jgi:hypothetical protein